MAVPGANREVLGKKINEDVCNIGGGECHTLTGKRDLTWECIRVNDPKGFI